MQLFSRNFIRVVALHCSMISLLLLVSATASPAEDFHNALSLQGFTGLLNTPNAAVTDEGKVYLLFSEQIENEFRSRTSREESYIFSVGFFSFAEIGGRLTEAPHVTRDLSANFKVRVPFIPKGYYLPDVAFGMQDVGGGAKKLQTKYLVASEEWWRMRLSLGYGSGPDRMKGVFGGAEFKAFDWLYLVGEHDAQETNMGARLVTPQLFGIPVNLQVTAKTSLDHRPGNMEFGFGLQFPLGFDRHNRTPTPEQVKPMETAPTSGKPAQPPAASHQSVNHEPVSDVAPHGSLEKLQVRLVEAGFQNVRVGAREDQLLVVEYENSRFNHNELDGLGVAIGMVVDIIPSGYETLSLVMKKKGIRVLQFSAPLNKFGEFLHDAGRLDGYSYPSLLRSSLVLYPALTTFVGTEVGAFDYLLSLKLDYYLNLWKGGVVNARWDIPVSWSENFDDGRAFRRNRNSSQLERVMLFQALKAAPGVMVNLGAGMVLHDLYGTLNEATWTPGDGTHRLAVKQAYVTSIDNRSQKAKNEAYLGSYRYYFNPLDLYLTGTGGRFFDNDTGFSAEMKRFFGDTAFTVYYKDSYTAAREHVQVGGVQVAFPLTPRRDMKPYPLQLRGTDEWSYAQETRIVTPGGRNFVDTSIGVNPQPPFSLERVFYNRDRLSEPYIRKHLLRLRDAYITYR
jgi:hypothetical protein